MRCKHLHLRNPRAQTKSQTACCDPAGRSLIQSYTKSLLPCRNIKHNHQSGKIVNATIHKRRQETKTRPSILQRNYLRDILKQRLSETLQRHNYQATDTVHWAAQHTYRQPNWNKVKPPNPRRYVFHHYHNPAQPLRHRPAHIRRILSLRYGIPIRIQRGATIYDARTKYRWKNMAFPQATI